MYVFVIQPLNKKVVRMVLDFPLMATTVAIQKNKKKKQMLMSNNKIMGGITIQNLFNLLNSHMKTQ